METLNQGKEHDKMKWLAMVLVMFSAMLFFHHPTLADDPVQAIVEAHRSGRMVPNPSTTDANLTVAGAYKIQEEVVGLEEKKLGPRVGFKAGLTGEAAQKKFGVTEPAYGVLMKEMMLEPGAVITASNYRRLFIEVEIALFIGKDITRALADEDEAKAAIEAVASAIELPDIRLADMKKLKGSDIIADNVGAAVVIIGPKIGLSDLADIDSIAIGLDKDGQTINQGQATDALGGQFKALMWLSKAITSRGGEIKKGQFVITGALGKMLPAKPGKYIAHYGELGEIAFTVK
jgi:2-keto-4-pentenoate hydratase